MNDKKSSPSPTIPTGWLLLGLVPALGLYGGLCYYLQFLQDDALITCRYVANALAGNGLVYNIGERVEGFTNFAWAMVLIIAGSCGLDIVVVARVLGLVCGAGVIVATWYLARILLQDEPFWYAYIPVYLVAANGALAYWAPAGLETAFFALVAALSLLCYMRRSHLLIASLLLGVWIRPDGALIAALIILAETVSTRRLPLFTLRCTLAALLLSLPFVGFKLAYYGSVLPNPYYAKTSFDSNQLANGLDYSWQFLSTYGFFGIGLLIPLFMYGRLNVNQRGMLIFLLGFIGYVTFIGGDVLKVNRFYLPAFGPSAAMVTLSLALILRSLPARIGAIALALLAAALMAVTWFVPHASIVAMRNRERGLITTMLLEARQLKSQDHSNFSIATATIGTIGYYLPGHRVIDLVGLTDTTIARHPDTSITDISSTWRERKFNAAHVLRESPDYVLFGTGVKPSSPGEQALFLYNEFLDAYRSFTVAFIAVGNGELRRPCVAYHRLHPVPQILQPARSVQFITDYKHALELANSGRHDEALKAFEQARHDLGSYVYPELLYQETYSLMESGRTGEAYGRLNKILAYDSLVTGPHRDLYLNESVSHDTAKASIHRHYLARLSPVDIPRADTIIAEYLNQTPR
jgi:arabinofuranosyltransferase